jgi:uncharacterized protein YkwD
MFDRFAVNCRHFALVALAATVLAGVTAAPAYAGACPFRDAYPEEASMSALEQATLCLVNRERRRRDLRALRPHAQLAQASLRHTLDMIVSKLFSHTSSNGSDFIDRIRRTGYMTGASRWWVGENIAYGYGSQSSPLEMVQSWMDSPDHRRNILDRRFRDIGVIVRPGVPEPDVDGGATYTTDFGKRQG